MFRLIELQNIRTFEKESFKFDDGINLIIGRNGSGKTTIVESLALFAFGRYQSARSDLDVIALGSQAARVEVEIIKEGEPLDASVALSQTKRINKLKEVAVPSSDIVGLQRTVLFNPETIDLVSGPPSNRRRELDMTIAQKEHLFINTLLEYRKALKQRNQLLKLLRDGKGSEGELDFWDEKLALSGSQIIAKRLGFIKYASSKLEDVFSHLSGKVSRLSVGYLPACDYSDFESVLIAKRDNDVSAGLTTVGPHRDDMEFVGGDFKLREGASRGEQRLAAFAFKLVEREYLDEGEPPVLLMDDIFSELDPDRRDEVVKEVDKGQVIITATDQGVVPESLGGKIIEL